ncbi:MAG: transposase, partial [Bacteroidetes bacterium]|nr:transposase [Bacteroidota bacterium]
MSKTIRYWKSFRENSQRNTRDENKKIKQDNGDELWNDKPNKKKHKDVMLDGQRKMEKHFLDIKIMRKLIQKTSNKEKSKTRARVEHVFGFMEQSMNGLTVKSVGIKRATGIIGLINLT